MEDEHRFIFISYANKDKHKMEPIVEYLENRNLPCWFAPRNIPFGENFQTVIINDIKKADAVLVLITENIAEARFVQKEVERALAYNKFVIPVFVDNTSLPSSLEFFLCDLQWIELYSYNTLEEGLEDLANYLEQNIFGQKLNLEIKKRINLKTLEVFPDTSNILLFRTHRETLNKINRVFVPPPKFVKMQQYLSEHHLLYLYHPFHTGKYSTTLALFSCLGIEEIYEWSKDTTFTQIFQQTIRQGAGYLIEIDSSEFLQSSSESMFDTYKKQLKEKQAYFVFIAKEKPGDHFLLPYTVKVDLPKNQKQLLLNHVEEEDAVLRDQISQWILKQAEEGKLPHLTQPGEAQKIISQIKALIQGKLDEKQFVRSLRENIEIRVNDWFKKEKNLEEIAFYLSISLFQEQTYDMILAKARQLTLILCNHFGKEPVNYLHNVAKKKCLDRYHAIEKPVWKPTDIGQEEQMQVILPSKEDTDYIWKYVWTQFPAYRLPIKDWFDQLLTEGNRWVEEQIFYIVFFLLKLNFTSVRKIFIEPWAKSPNKKEQVLAIRILEQLSVDPNWSHSVFRLIQSWVQHNDNGRLRWTAVTLLGSQVGAQYFPQSLKLLEETYNAKGYKLRFSIGRSLQNLSGLLNEYKDYEIMFYQFWRKWLGKLTDKKKSYLYKLAQTVFLSNPHLYLEANSKIAQEFWCHFIRFCFQDPIARNTVHVLLESLMIAAEGNMEKQRKVAILFTRVYQEGDQPVRIRIMHFILKGLRKDELLYRPYQFLVK